MKKKYMHNFMHKIKKTLKTLKILTKYAQKINKKINMQNIQNMQKNTLKLITSLGSEIRSIPFQSLAQGIKILSILFH